MASYLQVDNISKSYGDRVLFRNISFNINEGDKIALIAPNGTGKSTLLSILAGKDRSDLGGEVKFMKEIKVHFLEQEQDYDPDSDIFGTLFHGDSNVSSAIREYETALLSGDPSRLEKAMDRMDAAGGWELEQDIKTTLGQLGLDDCTRKISSLSGGERKRVALAAMMISKADFLVMDEPTNHLDLKTIEFLEEYLNKSRCTLLMVTHDRYFLDRICNCILELDRGSLYSYSGNYGYFLEKKQERIENFISETEKAKNLYRHELDWMRRMPQARGTKARYRIEAFEEIKETAHRHLDERKLDINVGTSRVGKKILECHNVSFRYGSRKILEDFSYKFARKEKIGIIGANGVGKSTFIKLITGALQPDSGEIQRGLTIKFGHYSQEGLAFRENQTVLETVREIAETVTLADGSRMSVTGFLNHFLFPPNFHNTKVEKLSGGERRRLYLLTVLMRNPNFLILDEPTNDLDIMTLNVLEDYLMKFDGPMVIVSHDRYFLDKITDHLFVFTGNGKVKDFPGSYTEYREYRKTEELEKKKEAAAKKPAPEQKTRIQTRKRLTYAQQKELENLDGEIAALTERRTEIEAMLSSGNLDAGQLQQLSEEYGSLKESLDEKEMRWLELSELA